MYNTYTTHVIYPKKEEQLPRNLNPSQEKLRFFEQETLKFLTNCTFKGFV